MGSHTESATFRIDKRVMSLLKTESNQSEVSLSTLVNQVLKHHVDWHANAAKAGYVPATKGLLIKLLDKIPEKDIQNIAQDVQSSEFRDIALLLKDEFDAKAVIDLIEARAKISEWKFKHIVEDTKHTFVIQHDMSKKWSIYLASRYKSVFEELGLRTDYAITPNTLKFIIDTKLTS